MVQVQLRLSQKMLEEIDKWVTEGRFKSRSDAIKTIISFYQEREKTREFYKMLLKRSEETPRSPHSLRGIIVPFTVLLHPKAATTLRKIEEPIKSRIKEKLRELKEKVGKPLKYSDFWSLRVGDYRAIYEINREKNQVIILFIGHRKKVYNDFSKLF